jgi:hypothetical protein
MLVLGITRKVILGRVRKEEGNINNPIIYDVYWGF